VSELVEAARTLLARAGQVWLSPQVAGSALTIVLVALVAARARFGPRGWRRLLTRHARTDAAYTAFYVGGFYAFFISVPLYRWLTGVAERHAPFLRLDLMAGLHPVLQFLVASLAMDGVLYWTHRAMHGSRLLWAFHCVHHSQSELTPLANFRFHAGEVLVRGFAQFVPGLLLGVPVQVFLPTVWLQVALDGLAHSGLGWGYGPLGSLIVSPRFHRVHHSTDPAHYERNFGMTYSFWDRLFGTAAEGRPAAFGTPELRVPESFLRQLAFPFVYLLSAAKAGRSDADERGP
jgi:sterol desaturase/sphingolipid hydroxylase (fatty acid hydroxylase superfamily)